MWPDDCCSAAADGRFLTLGLLLFGFLIYLRESRWICGTATVVSGHSLRIGDVRVRLHAVYALQPGQPWRDAAGREHDGGQISRYVLSQHINGRKVKARIQQEKDRYGRYPATVYLDCEDVGEWLVRNGHAVADRIDADRHGPSLRRYRRAERRARRARLGFHAGTFDDPADWIKNRVRSRFRERRPGLDPDALARQDRDRFIDEAAAIAREIADEMFTELAADFVLAVVL